jgi:hypothetical protein
VRAYVAGRYSHIKAAEVPGLRDTFSDWLVRRSGAVLDTYAKNGNRNDFLLIKEPIKIAAKEADLFCVAPDMLELARQAATASIDEISISEHDLPSPAGFVCFSSPLRVDLSYGQSTPIVGALWFRWQVDDFDTVTVAWLADRYNPNFEWTVAADGMPVNRLFMTGGRKVTAESWHATGDLRLAIHGMDNLAVGPVDPSAVIVGGDELFGDMRSDRAALKAVWLLMSQTLAEVERVKVGPPVQRRGGKTTARQEVRVIKLRRPSESSANGSADRDWHHRWMVRGHWRMQPWGPKRERVRPVWIAPHIKGPEGKPLLGGEKVYHLAR